MSDFLRTLFEMSAVGAIISAVIILLRIPLKKAPRKFSYMLWGILGIRLLCPFSLPSPTSLFNLFDFGSESSVTTAVNVVTNNVAANAAENAVNVTNAVNATAPAEAVTFGETAANEISLAAANAQGGIDIATVLFVVWALGAAAFLLNWVISYVKIRRRIANAVPLRENIYECADISGAFVMGIFRPRIYIPTELSERDREFIISHEKTHIRRRDYIIKPLGLLALCIHWFNPLTWTSFFLMTRDMEISCDERVVGDMNVSERKDYASALLRMSVKQNRLSGVLSFGESSIKQRIKSVLSPKKPVLWISIAAVAVIVAAAVCLLTSSVGDSRADDEDAADSSQSGMNITTVLSRFSSDELSDFTTDMLLVENEGDFLSDVDKNAAEVFNLAIAVEDALSNPDEIDYISDSQSSEEFCSYYVEISLEELDKNGYDISSLGSYYDTVKFYETGFTYASFYETITSVLDSDYADKLLKKHPFYIEYNGELWVDYVSRSGDLSWRGTEYDISRITQSDEYGVSQITITETNYYVEDWETNSDFEFHADDTSQYLAEKYTVVLTNDGYGWKFNRLGVQSTESSSDEQIAAEQSAATLNEENAAETVSELLNSFRLTAESDGSLSASFSMPSEIPQDTDGKTKLYVTRLSRIITSATERTMSIKCLI